MPSLSYSKVCNLEDFEHPEIRELIRTVFAHELQRFGPEFPRGGEYRKDWEIAMAIRALTDLGALRHDAEILGVGAGHESTIFFLTNKVKTVFATDLYLTPGVWREFANASMLTDPGQHWPGPWNPRRLVVQHMDALDLRYEDGSFDGIFSSSSIEHFGSHEAVRRAAAEMCRVLRPGGVLTLSTEFRVEGPSPGYPGCLMFDAEELEEWIVGDLPWSLASPIDFEFSGLTRRSEVSMEEHIADWHKHFAEFGQAVWHELVFRRYPQILLRWGEHLFTSVHLALRKASS